MCRHTLVFSLLVEFNRFDLEQVLAIIDKDELNASTEQIYRAVMRWVEADESR